MKSLITVIIIVLSIPVQGQIGNLLKKAAKSTIQNDKIQSLILDKATGELEDARAEYDSSSFNYAIALSDNAGLFESKEKYERHKKFLLEKVRKKNNDVSEIDQANALVDRSELMYANGKYKLAAGLLISAIAIYETEGGTESIDYAKSLANLGLVAHSGGRYTYSLDFTTRSLDLRKNILGENSKGYAASLNNYALLLKDLGRYNESENLLNKALELNRKTQGEESMAYAIVLNNLGVLNQSLGRTEDAGELYVKSINIAETHLKEKSANYQQLQTNLALLYQETERFDEAEKIYLNAIEIRKKRLGTSHPDYAHMLVNLAALYMDMGKYDKVEENLLEAKNIYEQKLGENSPSTATAYVNLGNFYRYNGDLESSVQNIRKGLRLRGVTLGNEHPDFVNSKEDLALTLWQMGEIEKSKELYASVMEETMNFINQYFLPMSEREKSKYWNTVRPRFQRYFNFVVENRETYPDLLSEMYQYHLKTKAILLNSSAKIKHQILNSNDEELKEKYIIWLDQKESLAKYYTYSKEDLAAENINLDSLEVAANSTEKYLSEKSNVFSDGLNNNLTTVKDIQSSLKENEAAIEIIRLDKQNQGKTEVRYVSFVVKNNDAKPELVILENGSDLETKFYKYYNNVIKNKIADDYSFDQFWAKIDNKLEGISHIYLSIDGVYNQINISSLKNPDGKYVSDYLDITTVGNSKDILNFEGRETPSVKQGITMYGYPNYGGDGSIKMLPGTKEELNAIENITKNKYNVQKNLADDANESSVKEVQSPSILHIATHGFFLEDIKTSNEKVFGVSVEKARSNPLLRSGLLFSNAGNTALADVENSLTGSNNGILTAFEALSLSLEGTDLVVLSACETGLGDIKAGEGVYGLQRSFLIAGANALIMSLWKVDDTATQKLMTEFYRNLTNGIALEVAFNKAQKTLKAKYPDPYYWGAFVLVRR